MKDIKLDFFFFLNLLNEMQLELVVLYDNTKYEQAMQDNGK